MYVFERCLWSVPCTFIVSYECSPFMYEYVHFLVSIKTA